VYSASAWQAEINSQINVQGGGVSTVGSWDGSRIAPYGGNISLGSAYFLNITGTNRVYWQMTGYPLGAPVSLSLNGTQKTAISIPYIIGGPKTAADVRQDIDASYGAGTFVRLWRMRDYLGNWEYYDGTPTGVPAFSVEPQRGYLIEVSRSITWVPWQGATPTPTPTVTPTPSITPTPTATPFDTYEPNNDFDHAAQITINTPVISYISYPYDFDYYKFTVPTTTTLYLSLTNLPDDYDLYLYDSGRREIEGSFQGGLTSEYITVTVGSGLYYTAVQGAGPAYDAIKPYKLLVTTQPQ
jgi:hypothetical protein